MKNDHFALVLSVCLSLSLSPNPHLHCSSSSRTVNFKFDKTLNLNWIQPIKITLQKNEFKVISQDKCSANLSCLWVAESYYPKFILVLSLKYISLKFISIYLIWIRMWSDSDYGWYKHILNENYS